MKGKKVFGAVLTGAVTALSLALLVLAFLGYKFATFTLIGAIINYVLSVVFHEVGHIIVAKIKKCQIIEWSVLGLGYSKINKKLKFSPKGFAGNLSFVSAKPDKAKSDLLAVSVSGVLANLIYLIICLVLGLIIFNFYSFSLLLAGSFTTVYMLVINAFPIIESNDGAVYLGLKRGKPEYRATENLAKIISQLYNGLSPAQIDNSLYLNKDGFNGEGVEYYFMLSLMEREDYAQAYDIAQEYSANYPEQFLPEKLYLALKLGHNSEVEEIADRALGYLNPTSATYFRICAVYRRFNGECEWADLCKKSAITANEGQFFKGLARLEENLINQN